MTSESHNGWSNRNTWLVNLWLNENEHSQKFLLDTINEAANDQDAGEQLRQALEGQAIDTTGESSLFTDMLIASLNQVAWVEIVEASR